MKAIKAIFLSMVMAIALVTFAHAATSVPANSNYACVSMPAYTNYVNVHPAPCPVSGSPVQTPWAMSGSE